MKEKVPCQNCPDRIPASDNTTSCHVTCEKYNAFSEKNKQNNIERLRKLKAENTISTQMRKTIYKGMRWK